MRNLWLSGILCLASTATAVSQTIKSSSDDPVRILSVTSNHDQPNKQFEVELYNQSTKGVVAYAVRIRRSGLSGRTGSVKGPRPGVDVIPDSTSWTTGVQLTAQPEEEAEIYIDFVRFDDGSTWGPNDTHYAEWVEGFLAGYRGAKSGLRSLLKRDGVEALLAEIERK